MAALGQIFVNCQIPGCNTNTNCDYEVYHFNAILLNESASITFVSCFYALVNRPVHRSFFYVKEVTGCVGS